MRYSVRTYPVLIPLIAPSYRVPSRFLFLLYGIAEELAAFARAQEIRRPERGNLESLLKKKDQAEIQLKGREEGLVKYEMLDVVEEHGLNRLPEPSDGNIYFDIEGDAFYEDGGLEYLLGFVYKNSDGEWVYDKIWSRNRKEEKKAFRKFMDFVMNRWKSFPGMCIYHFAPYEPSHVKRLMQTHAVAESEVAKLLRGLRFVDLYSIVKESLIASVERYSLKDLEHLANYARNVPLPDASLARRHVECAIELGELKSIRPSDVQKVEVYNQDDCLATLAAERYQNSEKVWKQGMNSPAIKRQISRHLSILMHNLDSKNEQRFQYKESKGKGDGRRII